MEADVERYADSVLALTRRRIEIFDEAGEDWRFAESLKSISEDTAQEYEGRAVLELVQNGHDALADGSRGRIGVVLDLTEAPGVLYVANEGAPFTKTNFRAITEFALSDKGTGEGIGNKGLGFRSVLQLTDWPEVYSKDRPGPGPFNGYCFRFAAERDLEQLVGKCELLDRVLAKVSPLALPVPAAPGDPVLTELAAAGYSTVVRLPLRSAHAAAAARAQVEGLADTVAPLLLFLDRVASLSAEVRTAGASPIPIELTREIPRSARVAGGDGWACEVDLGGCGTYLLGRRPLDPSALKASIEESVAARMLDERWSEWDGSGAWVGLALRLDEPLGSGRLYTFLPMAESPAAPLTAHAHAPFFTKLDRRTMSESVPLNDHLLNELAALSARLLRAVRDGAPPDIAARLVPDLACWQPHERLDQALGGALADEPIVPLEDGRGWASLREAFDWVDRERPWTVLTRQALAHLGQNILDASAVGEPRRARLAALHVALTNMAMGPSPETVADWCEVLARSLPAPDSDATAQRWGAYYDDLHQAFAAGAGPLKGRLVVLDSSGTLRATLGGDSGREGTLFFSPEQTGPDPAPRVPSDLRVLRARIAFTHPDISWSKTARLFFENAQLVREYRTDRVFDALRDLLAKSSSDPLRRDALAFAFRQFPSLNSAQRASLSTVGFFVPRADGRWAPAEEALLSPAWDAEGASRLQRCLGAGGNIVARLVAQKGLWIADPGAWRPAPVADPATYRAFLQSVGVRDGLLLTVLDPVSERQGNSLVPKLIARQFDLPEQVTTEWAADVAVQWRGGNYPNTQYAFASSLVALPGAGETAALTPTAQREFAELVLYGLSAWDDAAFRVMVWRPTRSVSLQDRQYWPTPLASALRHLPWLPIQGDEGDLEFRTPAQVWFSADGDLPPFVPSMPRSVRHFLGDARALGRASAAGLRRWDDPAHAAAAVRELGVTLQDGAVPDHLGATFRKEYSRALADAARAGASPWLSQADVVLAADRSGRLEPVRPSPDEPLYLPDERDPLKQSLVELAGHPVVVADPEAGEQTAALLRGVGLNVIRLSEIDVQVFSGEQQVLPEPGRPLLIDKRDWLVTVVGVVLELEGGQFRRRRTERTMRALLTRLRAIRLARLPDVTVSVGGVEALPSMNVRSVPLPDADYPTIAVWDAEGEWDELQACAPALAHLLGQPYLYKALQLALIKIEKLLGDDHPESLDDALLARALDTTAARIVELRRGITGDLDGLKHRLHPVLACVVDAAEIHALGDAIDECTSEQALESLLAVHQQSLPLPAPDVMALVRHAGPLAEIRDALGLDFATFNAALAALGPPYAPLTHPDLHEAAFADFVASTASAMLDRLREYYRPLAEQGLPTDGYVSGRIMDGLDPDPSWLPLCRIPSEEQMRAQVGEWLRSHGAADDLDAACTLPAVADMRSRARARLDLIVRRAGPLVHAWCRAHSVAVPPRWEGTPLLEASFELESSGLADLVEVEDQRLLEAAAGGAGWPEGMAVTLDTAALGLTDPDLAVPIGAAAASRRTAPVPVTISIGDSVLPVGTDNLARIAEVTLQSLDPAFLSQSGKTSLAELAALPGRGGEGKASGRVVVARSGRMNDDERAAVGLVGEIAARAWLAHKYREVWWRSGYAAIVSGDPDASDSFGYDIEAAWRNTTLMFEVKALRAEPGTLVEFEMGESEVRAAQGAARGNRYRILLVTRALDPAERRILELPNPFSAKGQGRFRVAGRGLRYQCAPR